MSDQLSGFFVTTGPDGSRPGASVVAVHGDVDMATAPALRARVTEALSERPQVLLFDLAAMTFMDCSGVGVIAYARNRLSGDCQVILRCPTPLVRQVLELTGMDGPCVIED
jgi:anti-sigma B factor antagonist